MVSVLSFCRSVLQSPIGDNDIEVAHRLSRQTSPSAEAIDTNQSASQDSVVIVRFSSQQVRDEIIKRRKVLKRTRQSIMEDLTALNVATLNHLKNNNLVDKCWSWNGQLLATLRDSKKIMVKRYQPVQKATVVNYVNHVSDLMYYRHLTTVSCGGIWSYGQ